MNRFNLEFSGEILSGEELDQVKLRFGKMFAIDDPERIDRFFCGDPIILRRNLDRKEAAQWFQDIRKLGAVAELVKITTRDKAAAITGISTSAATKLAELEQKQQHESSTAVAKQAKAEQRAREKQRLKAEQAAQRSARKAEAELKAREDATRRKHELAEKRRLAAEKNARREAELAEQQRLAAEQAAQREAELAEQQRLAAAEAVRQEAELAQERRLAAEEAARRKADEERIEAEQARQQAAEAARLEAERLRQQAEREEAKRLRKEAEKQRKKAALERKNAERQRKIAEREKKNAQREQQKAERAQQKAEREKLKAEQDKARRVAAEEAARRAAQHKEQERIAAEEAARRKAELANKKRQQAEQATRRRARKEQQKREAAQQAAQREAARVRKQAEADAAERAAMEDKAIQRGAEELARQTALKPAKARARTSMEVPQRLSGQGAGTGAPGNRKRQPGEPNLYMLRPFRNTTEVRDRAQVAGRRMRQGLSLGVLALIATLILVAGLVRHTPQQPILGASAIVITPQGGPLLLAGHSLLFHDRAGVEKKQLDMADLGINNLEPPLAFAADGALLARGDLLTGGIAAPEPGPLQLLRCDLNAPPCQIYSPALADSNISAFAIHPLTGNLLLADTDAGVLLKSDSEGKVVARADITLPDAPVLRLHSGLLMMNSAQGPAISVFRYDDNAFAEQLDEIMLLPPPAVAAEQSRVADFLWSGDSWWVTLFNPDSLHGGLYRFDAQWNYLDEVALGVDTLPLQLANWGNKILLNDLRSTGMARFSSQGSPEAPLESALLANLVQQQAQRGRLAAGLFQAALLLCALLAAIGLGFGYLQGLRRLVYKSHRERGAEPVDDHVDALHWIDRVQNRRELLRRRGISYAMLATAAVLLAAASEVSALQLGALLLALSGPAIALALLARRPVGHIGILDERLLLVDHSGMYHLGGGSRLQYRGPFLFIDDVTVFSGTRLLPTFSSGQVSRIVKPVASGGVRVDRTTVLVKLLQNRHPLAMGAAAIMATALAALVLWGISW